MRTVEEAEALLSRMTPGDPVLRAEDLASAWAYVRSHHDEIDQQIRDHEGA